jgi:hypothetical protein
MFTKQFERRVYIALAVILCAGMVGVAFGAYILWPSNREAGYEPDQPIPFSHKMHAGDLKIECLYCHSSAETGPQATVPPVATCMNCHSQVPKNDKNDVPKEATAILLKHWDEGMPIVWNKVNDLADFVYFDHSRHLAADLDCTECHGPVDTMERMRREFGQKMSWCLNCHKESIPADHPRALQGFDTRAPINCTTCHR